MASFYVCGIRLLCLPHPFLPWRPIPQSICDLRLPLLGCGYLKNRLKNFSGRDGDSAASFSCNSNWQLKYRNQVCGALTGVFFRVFRICNSQVGELTSNINFCNSSLTWEQVELSTDFDITKWPKKSLTQCTKWRLDKWMLYWFLVKSPGTKSQSTPERITGS